jgi:hypothetical protein
MLSQDMQAEILLQFGVYTELIRYTSQLNIELYTLYDFYVEIYFDKVTEDPIFLRPFNLVSELEPYWQLIEIDSLFETK